MIRSDALIGGAVGERTRFNQLSEGPHPVLQARLCPLISDMQAFPFLPKPFQKIWGRVTGCARSKKKIYSIYFRLL